MIRDLYLKLVISNSKKLTQQESNVVSQGRGNTEAGISRNTTEQRLWCPHKCF